MSDETVEYLKRINRELETIRKLLSEGLFALRVAEGEVPEKMRRFVTYAHDIHDIAYMYESRGLDVPAHVHREMERVDDRYRQLLAKEHSEGTFSKVRQEMAKDPLNRWDHTRQLTGPKKEEK